MRLQFKKIIIAIYHLGIHSSAGCACPREGEFAHEVQPFLVSVQTYSLKLKKGVAGSKV